ncbi:unnamed protein product [Rotaria sp. Silwood1]|nr:unnamed protein product [Rotaria sp. Silwood1]CAF3817411.1 unnamed protein product [Rotaria sp. Silwood1]CAF3837840.1 unnamed protein product [Rotaria sp. Silwood1]CAF3911968.1 unnamed protein product [Rotaria sp. Silwood1]CAF4649639.1 unnamed protein product [Rotaria sp. Silwood1]
MSSINQVANSITIYLGLPIFIFGTSGNLLNIRLLWRTRRNPCAFIFLVISFINCIVLFYGLFTKILSVNFHVDWFTTNLIWCKTRALFGQASFLISLTCTCLASIDRFLVSCRQEKYRKLSRLSIATWAIILIIIFWLALFLPFAVHTELVQNLLTGLLSCTYVGNQAFVNYQIYFAFPIYYGLLPSTILIITGLLTYRNTNKLQIRRQRQVVQKQLTSMMLLQIPIILFSTLPYIIFTEYSIFTATMTKTANQKAIELVITNIVSITCYITFACPFFVFFASSKSFRKETKMLLLCRKTTLLRTNQVQPYSTMMVGSIPFTRTTTK